MDLQKIFDFIKYLIFKTLSQNVDLQNMLEFDKSIKFDYFFKNFGFKENLSYTNPSLEKLLTLV